MNNKLEFENNLKILNNNIKVYEEEYARILKENEHVSSYWKTFNHFFLSYVVTVVIFLPCLRASDFPDLLNYISEKVGFSVSAQAYILLFPLIVDSLLLIPRLISNYIDEKKINDDLKEKLNVVQVKINKNKKLIEELKEEFEKQKLKDDTINYGNSYNLVNNGNNNLVKTRIRVLRK